LSLNHLQSNLLQSADNWHGQLQLEFSYRSDEPDSCEPGSGKTLLSHSHMQAPLKVQRPFYPEGGEICHTVMLHTAGGIVGGDRLSLDIRLHPQALALITTASAAKVYRSSGAAAQQNTQIHLAAGSSLEWFPQEAIVFDGAIYRQDLRIDLEADAMWTGWEITRLGRTARGEKFSTGEWRSRTEVWQQGRPVWIDPQYLVGGSEMLDSPHGLAGYPVIGSLACIGQAASPELVTKARSLFTPSATSQAGVTRLRSGLLCRYRGHSTTEARHWFTQVWHLLRPIYGGRSVCVPRVWQV
jgi:urease accessory protein